jgi:hypothetical protein
MRKYLWKSSVGKMQENSGLLMVKLLLVFAVVFSLANLPGPLSGSTYHLPSLHLANACVGCVPDSPWYPAGSSMDTEVVDIFSSAGNELSALAGGTIDLTDSPLPPLFCAPIVGCSNLAVTNPVSSTSEFEVEFNQANQFWGVPFQFGNAAKGIQIRQGIDHLVDRAAFVANDPNLGGNAMAIDNPVTPSDGLPTPNACGWDVFANATETGSNCVVGGDGINTGGTAYHLATACTASPCPGPTVWSPGPGSPDLCIAANHFIAAGIATGHNANCQLTGLNATAVANPPTFFIRNDNFPRLDLGTSMAEEICYLFTGSFSLGASSCAGGAGLNFVFGTIATVVSIIFSTPGKGATSPNLSWWIYTAGFGGVFPFDTLLYFEYNSLFVDAFGLPAGNPCATTAGTTSAYNYMYVCVPAYDSISSQMEFSPCLSAPGDPVPGQTTPSFADCPGSSKLTAVSAGYKAEDTFGKEALTLPVYTPTFQFGYLSNWSKVVNAEGVGLPNYFTWLNAYSPNPAVPGTIRQGFQRSTSSLNPYAASTAQDFYMLNNIYDTLYKANPLSPTQIMDWMTASHEVLSNTQLGYTPPLGTMFSIRNILRNGLSWHDGSRLTAWDVKFSLQTLATTGFQQLGLPLLLGVTVLSPSEFDINLSTFGPFTTLGIGSPTIIPGRHWSICGEATWDTDVAAGSVPDSCMNISSLTPTVDPLAAGILIGSGPWMCRNLSTGVIGGGCSSTGLQNPPAGGSYTLTRFGAGFPPAGSFTSSYSRSSGFLALWIWTGNTGNLSNDFVNFSQVAFCFDKSLGTTGCTHWQQGIGAPGGSSTIGIRQLAEVAAFFLVNWTSPYTWTGLTDIGVGPAVSLDGVPAPVLYEGSAVLNPASVAGCSLAYPAGGYDC